jgi:hypothetical protein
VTHQVQPKPGALPLRPDGRVRQPDRRHELAARQLGQHPGVNPVGLAGQRRQPLHLLRVGDLHLRAVQLELVVRKAGRPSSTRSRRGSAHRSEQPSGQTAKTVRIRWGAANVDRLTSLVQQAEVETLAAEIQSGVQHRRGLPSSRRGRAEHDSAGGPPSSDSLPCPRVPTGRSPRQRFSRISAAVDVTAFATGCHWLRPLCSINAPS